LKNLDLKKDLQDSTSLITQNEKVLYIFRGFYHPTPVQFAILNHIDYIRKAVGKAKGFFLLYGIIFK
jgi:hypothetical protein